MRAHTYTESQTGVVIQGSKIERARDLFEQVTAYPPTRMPLATPVLMRWPPLRMRIAVPVVCSYGYAHSNTSTYTAVIDYLPALIAPTNKTTLCDTDGLARAPSNASNDEPSNASADAWSGALGAGEDPSRGAPRGLRHVRAARRAARPRSLSSLSSAPRFLCLFV
eukprot:1700597-Rhodomonas_salina.1